MDKECLTNEKLEMLQRNWKTLFKGKEKIPEERIRELYSIIISDSKELLENGILPKEQAEIIHQLVIIFLKSSGDFL